MWASAQRDGCPRRKVWLTPAAGVPCSNAANVGELKTWTRVNFATCKIHFVSIYAPSHKFLGLYLRN